jgi:hypothetical protein
VPLEIFTPPAAGALLVVVELGAGVELPDDLLELPHPAAANATAGTIRSTASLLTETSFGKP